MDHVIYDVVVVHAQAPCVIWGVTDVLLPTPLRYPKFYPHCGGCCLRYDPHHDHTRFCSDFDFSHKALKRMPSLDGGGKDKHSVRS